VTFASTAASISTMPSSASGWRKKRTPGTESRHAPARNLAAGRRPPRRRGARHADWATTGADRLQDADQREDHRIWMPPPMATAARSRALTWPSTAVSTTIMPIDDSWAIRIGKGVGQQARGRR
jgi:hypothetical protein